MKCLIVSDIHGSAYWAKYLAKAIEQQQPDKIVLLGDLLYHGPRNDLPKEYDPKQVITLLNKLSKTGKVLAVRGNCDAEVDQMIFPAWQTMRKWLMIKDVRYFLPMDIYMELVCMEAV